MVYYEDVLEANQLNCLLSCVEHSPKVLEQGIINTFIPPPMTPGFPRREKKYSSLYEDSVINQHGAGFKL